MLSTKENKTKYKKVLILIVAFTIYIYNNWPLYYQRCLYEYQEFNIFILKLNN